MQRWTMSKFYCMSKDFLPPKSVENAESHGARFDVQMPNQAPLHPLITHPNPRVEWHHERGGIICFRSAKLGFTIIIIVLDVLEERNIKRSGRSCRVKESSRVNLLKRQKGMIQSDETGGKCGGWNNVFFSSSSEHELPSQREETKLKRFRLHRISTQQPELSNEDFTPLIQLRDLS